MGAREKLDRLKWTWVAYAAFVAIVLIATEGISRDSLLAAAISVAITWGIAAYLTKQLWQRSSLVWAFGVVFGLLNMIGAAIVIIEMIFNDDGYGFDIPRFLITVASGIVHFRTFRTLRDRDVKRHVMIDD